MTDKSPPLTASLGFGLLPRAKPPRGHKDETAPSVERKARILVIDPDPESRRFMTTRLATANYIVESTEGGQAALDACVRARPNLIITDLHLDHMNGLALLKELKSRWPSITVIIVTAHATIPEAVEATQCGAFGFLIKPLEKAELLGQVERAVAASTFTRVEGNWRSDIVSRSQLMEERLGLANRAAGSDEPVLLTGENGTGKELLARAIHAGGARRDRPFVAVRCRDATEASLDIDLFGRADMAIGGELARDPGALVRARGGTLLLDEIDQLPARLQIELMAALRAREFGGGQGPGAAQDEIRLICTTSSDLKHMMQSGEFRQDLYYHINILPIEIPPLGRRREDIPLLVSHFLEQVTEEGGSKKIYTPGAIELLATTDWPGNVRQLFELVKQNVALSHGKIMSREFVERSLGKDAKKVPTYDEARDTFARGYLAQNLQTTAGNVSQSARLAKRNRTDFYKLLARYRLEPDDFKGEPAQKKSGSKD
jgi:two-component system, NtrC family, response regulator GlrR